MEGAILPGERRRLHRRAAEVLAASRPRAWRTGRRRRAGRPLVGRGGVGRGTGGRPSRRPTRRPRCGPIPRSWPTSNGRARRSTRSRRSDPAAAERALAATGLTRVALIGRTSDAAYLAGAGARSVELARQLVEASTGVVGTDELARAYVTLGRNAWSVGDAEAAFEAYRQAAEPGARRAAVGGAGPHPGRGGAGAHVAVALRRGDRSMPSGHRGGPLRRGQVRGGTRPVHPGLLPGCARLLRRGHRVPAPVHGHRRGSAGPRRPESVLHQPEQPAHGVRPPGRRCCPPPRQRGSGGSAVGGAAQRGRGERGGGSGAPGPLPRGRPACSTRSGRGR